MNKKIASSLRKIIFFKNEWENASKDKEVIEKQYCELVRQLLDEGWDYILGAENEIVKNKLPDKYFKQKQNVLDALEDALIEHKSEMRDTLEDPEKNAVAYQKYYDVFSEVFWVNGGVFWLDAFSEISDKNMPTAYMKHWVKLSRNEEQKNIKKLCKIKESLFKEGSQNESSLKNEYSQLLDKLLDAGWDYALGKEMELDEKDMPPRYISHKKLVIARLEKKLREAARQYLVVKDDYKQAHSVIMSYYDTFIELLWINGGIDGLVLDEHLPMEKMPKVYQYYCEIMAA